MSKFKVLVTDYEYENIEQEIKILEANGAEVIQAQCRTEEEVIEAGKDVDGIINQYAPITRKVIEALPNCKVITRYGVGLDTIDIDAATEKGICVANVPDYGVDEVSDHALALILNLLRKVTVSNQHIKNKVWDIGLAKPVRRFNTLNVGLVGFGNIPKRLAEKLIAIGFNVLVSDPFVPKEVADEKGVTLLSLEELCAQSDLISVHAPLNQHTKGMIGKTEFALMKKGAFIVNTARGPVIDEAAMIVALESGHIAGAGLDVLETEPVQLDNPLIAMENVILTPHIAGYSAEAYHEMRAKAALGVVDVLAHGQYPKYHVNKDAKDKAALNDFSVDEHYDLKNIFN